MPQVDPTFEGMQTIREELATVRAASTADGFRNFIDALRETLDEMEAELGDDVD